TSQAYTRTAPLVGVDGLAGLPWACRARHVASFERAASHRSRCADGRGVCRPPRGNSACDRVDAFAARAKGAPAACYQPLVDRATDIPFTEQATDGRRHAQGRRDATPLFHPGVSPPT